MSFSTRAEASDRGRNGRGRGDTAEVSKILYMLLSICEFSEANVNIYFFQSMSILGGIYGECI